MRHVTHKDDYYTTLQSLSHQNQVQRDEIARQHFRNMVQELRSGKFLYEGVHSDTAAPKSTPFTSQNPYLRPILVPLGTIVKSGFSDSLPVLAIQIATTRKTELQKHLLDLLSEHHRKPFARLVFLVDSLEILPFLGRYGFAYEQNLGIRDVEFRAKLSAKYGVVEIRDLVTQKVLN